MFFIRIISIDKVFDAVLIVAVIAAAQAAGQADAADQNGKQRGSFERIHYCCSPLQAVFVMDLAFASKAAKSVPGKPQACHSERVVVSGLSGITRGDLCNRVVTHLG